MIARGPKRAPNHLAEVTWRAQGEPMVGAERVEGMIPIDRIVLIFNAGLSVASYVREEFRGVRNSTFWTCPPDLTYVARAWAGA